MSIGVCRVYAYAYTHIRRYAHAHTSTDSQQKILPILALFGNDKSVHKFHKLKQTIKSTINLFATLGFGCTLHKS